MKKLYLFLVGVLACAGLAQAETTSMITYNPSRMGRYTNLKISNKAKFAQGLGIDNNLTVNTATMQWSDNENHKYTMANSSTGNTLIVPTLRGYCTDCTAVGDNWSASDSTPPDLRSSIEINEKGGTLDFDKTNKNSYVGTISQYYDPGTILFQIYAGTININSSSTGFEIGGDNPSDEFELINDGGTGAGTIRGFSLAGGSILHPKESLDDVTADKEPPLKADPTPITEYNKCDLEWLSPKGKSIKVLGYNCKKS